MPETPTQFWQKIVEGVAIKFIIAAIVGAGGIVLTWLTARSAYLSGRPFYQVAPYIAGVFCLLAVGFYYCWLWIERMQVYAAETQLKWLREIAERDKLRIDKALCLQEYRLSRRTSLGAPAPHLGVVFSIFNGSVYPITFEREIKGFLKFGGMPLEGRLVATPEHLFPDAEPHKYASIGVTLYLREDQARMIDEALQRGEGQPLNLDQLQLTVVGARASDEIAPQTIDLYQARVSFT
ncbi:MAG TPA: hypothetical protein DC047_18045 [Blastocatellia bacterium]|nr:hypothetical protein [Blastocatellia bacterium]